MSEFDFAVPQWMPQLPARFPPAPEAPADGFSNHDKYSRSSKKSTRRKSDKQSQQRIDGGAQKILLRRPPKPLFRQGIRDCKETPSSGIFHQIIYGNDGWVKKQHGRQLFHPPPAVKDNDICTKSQKHPKKIGKVIGINRRNREQIRCGICQYAQNLPATAPVPTLSCFYS